MTEEDDVLFCEYEEKHFPRGDFYSLEGWGLVHNVAPLHTKEGTIVNRPTQIDRPLDVPNQELE